MNKESRYTNSGLTYIKPVVTNIYATPLGMSELAARTCYESLSKSENYAIRSIADSDTLYQSDIDDISDINHSELLDKLAWVNFHHSVLEHVNLSYYIKHTSRGVLQEQSRHRIQSLSVKSTRYTLGNVISAYIAANGDKEWFITNMLKTNIFVTMDDDYNAIELGTIFDKLKYQHSTLNDNFYEIALSKSALDVYNKNHGKVTSEEMLAMLFLAKSKRNVGDAFKHIVTDNFRVDMVVTFNLRSFKNYVSLRNSNAAYFQIRELVKAIIDVTPDKYLDLIMKRNNNDSKC